MEERRARQEGRFAVQYSGQKLACQLVCQGTKAGERAIVQLTGLSVKIGSLVELGMREKMAEQLKELLADQQGIVLFSSMSGGGLSTTMTVALRSTDRFMRDFIELRDAESEEPEVENVPVQHYHLRKGEGPDALLPAVLRKEPNVVVVRDLPNASTVSALCEASESCLIIATVQAKEAVEALLRVLLVKAPVAPFASAVKAVVCQRLIRRLCEECKQAYAPPAELLKKLGLPAGRVQSFYRPPQPDPQEKKEICQRCGGIGYFGQIAIFELLQVDDRIREALLVKQPNLDVLRRVARAAGNRSQQDEGIVLVARGVTSLAELQRVLKQ
jgi:type II secretory ATPase GspE/PulE/Tfp pilus assembly ATPase PilB-like protein